MAKGTMWREAPEVKEIADRLIPEHHQRIELYMDEIRYVFRDKAAKSLGNTVFGKAYKVGGMNCYLMHSAPGDVNKYGEQPPNCFVIEIAENVWENLTTRQRTALVDHELCLPAGTVVTGPRVLGGGTRWYTGHLVTIRTAAGNLLSGTPNHPVLTDKGWIPIGFLHEGDNVVRCGVPERVAAAVDPDQYQVPALIEQIASADKVGFGFVPQAAEEFYADIPHYQVNIVGTDGALLLNRVASFSEHSEKVEFRGRNTVHMLFSGNGGFRQVLSGVGGSAPDLVSHSDALPSKKQFIGPLHSVDLGVSASAPLDAGLVQPPGNCVVCHTQALGDGVGRLASNVPLDNSCSVQRDSRRSGSRPIGAPSYLRLSEPSPWDSSFIENSPDYGTGDAESLAKRLSGLSSDVSLDEITSVEVSPFTGHVYNLQSSRGWYIANGIVTHNCHLDAVMNEQTGDMNPVLRPHDIEEFREIVARHGAWHPPLTEFAEALQLKFDMPTRGD